MKILVFIIIILIVICIIISVLGREEGLNFLIKFLPPLCILVFYFSRTSISVSILSALKIRIENLTEFSSTSVAVDSAFITLILNTAIQCLASPIKVEIGIENPRGLSELEVDCQRASYLNFILKVDYRNKILKKVFGSNKPAYLKICNTDYTAIEIDRKEQYDGILKISDDCKEVKVDLNKIVSFGEKDGKLYFRLAFVSNKTIRWEGKIHPELYVEGRVRKFMWRGNPCTMKLIHIEE